MDFVPSQKCGVVRHAAVAKRIRFDEVDFVAILALHGHRRVIGVDDSQLAAARAAHAILRVNSHWSAPCA
jgi:hypothetical protein